MNSDIIATVSFLLLFSGGIFAQNDTIVVDAGKRLLVRKMEAGKKIGVWKEFNLTEGRVDKEIDIKSDTMAIVSEYSHGPYEIELSSRYEALDSNNHFVKNGLCQFFGRNRQMMWSCYYVRGKRNGQMTTYYQNEAGAMTSRIGEIYLYKDDILNGPSIMYDYETGYVRLSGRYEAGLRVGNWIENYRNKNLKSEGSYYPEMNYLYKNPNTKIFYLADRNMNTLRDYSGGFRIDTFLYNRGIEYRFPLSFPMEVYFKDGLWKYYTENGMLQREEIYLKGRLIQVREANPGNKVKP